MTGDTQTKSDAARASAKSMIEKDGAVMITGGSSSGVAVAVQGLCQEAGVIFRAGWTHSNDTTGKDKKANGFRHFFNSYMSGAALAPVLGKAYGNDRKAYHLTADYNWATPLKKRSVLDGSNGLGDGCSGQDSACPDRFHPTSRRFFNRRLMPGAEPLWRQHGKFAHQCCPVRTARAAANGRILEIVVPLYSRLMAKGAGANVKGIFGSTNGIGLARRGSAVRRPSGRSTASAESGSAYLLCSGTSMLTLLSGPEASIPCCRRGPEGFELTEWVMARLFIVQTTTSASRTFLW